VTADRDTTLTPHVCEAITSVQAHTWAAAHRRMFDSPESVAARAALESAILSAIREAREDEESLKVAERLQKERWIARAEGVERALSRAESERDALAEALRGACDVWFGRTLYPTFSGEKQRRMDVAMEAARAALNGARHAE
jgi:hypothetical protein